MADTQDRIPLLQRTAPERIWLQVSNDPCDLNTAWLCDSEATWSHDGVVEAVPYVRADLIQPLPDALPRKLAGRIVDEVFGGAIGALAAAPAAPVQPAPATREPLTFDEWWESAGPNTVSAYEAAKSTWEFLVAHGVNQHKEGGA